MNADRGPSSSAQASIRRHLIVGLMLVRALFLDNALSQFYQAHLIAKVDYADILYIAPWLFLLGVSMAAVTGYATLRLYIRR